MCLRFSLLVTSLFISSLSTSCTTTQAANVEQPKGKLQCVRALAGDEIVDLCVVTPNTVCVFASHGVSCFTEESAKGGSI